jgi:hypothetical protein
LYNFSTASLTGDWFIRYLTGSNDVEVSCKWGGSIHVENVVLEDTVQKRPLGIKTNRR